MKGFLAEHEGRHYPVHHPDGHVEWLTAKEYLAGRARLNAAHPLATLPSPGAGERRVHNPAGVPLSRPARTPDETP
jgi:hypothetical protein